MELINLMVAERATVEKLSLDRMMNARVNLSENSILLTLFGGCGGLSLKVIMSQYTYSKLGYSMKADVDEGLKYDLYGVKELGEDAMEKFMPFYRSTPNISYEQSAALFLSQTIPNCRLVSDSEQVLDFAHSLGVSNMHIDELQKELFAEGAFVAEEIFPPDSTEVVPFDPRVDADKVEAAFTDRLDGDLAVLKQKSYWAVVCVLFEWNKWINVRKRSEFCRWVNAHFHFDKPINAEIDIKSAINKIKVKEHNLELWPDNAYRDLAYLLKDLFWGERQGLPNGYYTYAREPLYLKPGKIWRRNDS